MMAISAVFFLTMLVFAQAGEAMIVHNGKDYVTGKITKIHWTQGAHGLYIDWFYVDDATKILCSEDWTQKINELFNNQHTATFEYNPTLLGDVLTGITEYATSLPKK